VADIAPWMFLPVGYLATVLIETPILMLGLARRHPLVDRVIAGLWLTACTYPIVILVLPALLDAGSEHWQYILTAEVFAPVAECLLFWRAYGRSGTDTPSTMCRDFTAIVVANIASFAVGEALHAWGWPGLLQ